MGLINQQWLQRVQEAFTEHRCHHLGMQELQYMPPGPVSPGENVLSRQCLTDCHCMFAAKSQPST